MKQPLRLFLPKYNIVNSILALILWIPLTLMAQHSKKPIPQQEEYGLWGHLSAKEISSNGHWTSFAISYDSGKDTLFIARTNGKARKALPGCRNGAFIGNGWYSCQDKDNALIIITLATEKSLTLDGVSSYTIDAPRERIILMQKQGTANRVIILSLKDNKRFELPACLNYQLDAVSGKIAYCSREGNSYVIKIVHPGGDTPQDVDTGLLPYCNFRWAADGSKLGFLAQSEIKDDHPAAIHLFDLGKERLYTFDPTGHTAYGNQLGPLPARIKGFEISVDGEQLFWTATYITAPADTKEDIVQIWHSGDRQLHIMNQYLEPVEADVLVAWQPMPDTFSIISDRDYSTWTFNNDKSHALLSNSKPYEPSSEFYQTKDYRLADMKKGSCSHLLSGLLSSPWSISFSHNGKYLVYFKDLNWWIYDTMAAEHHCITDKLPQKFYSTDSDIPKDIRTYGSPVWTVNDEEVLLYDEYDIWSFDMKTMKGIRLTNGRKEAKRFRFPEPQPGSSGLKAVSIDLACQQVLLVSSGNNTGLALYKEQATAPLIMADAKINNVFAAQDGIILYMQQSFNSPPAIMTMQWRERKARLVYQSNRHHKKYSWGSSELISFSNAQGKSLKGVLYYPAGYDPDITYPMVVHIYDKQSSKQHWYVNPSLYNENGFNIANFTTKGYFVLLPDISYQVGNPGKSALDCVTSAVREVIATKRVDPKRIGLIGHSFGGYETDYIITQTDIFAAAVSGAAISNMVSSYLAVSKNNAGPNFYYYESGQLRMGGALSEDCLGYVNNSPVFYAHQVTTPLLSWCGEDDGQVDPSQSFEFYMALRRTNKEHTLLVFPNQGHIIADSLQQCYLTNAIEAWFGYYLKEDPKPKWLE